jgi:uncharacterized repeat protein (TIGR03803 family)
MEELIVSDRKEAAAKDASMRRFKSLRVLTGAGILLLVSSGLLAQGELAAPKFTTLCTFTGPNGANPFGALLRRQSGVLIGFSFSGGAFNSGTVFQLVPPETPGAAWTETILHSFGLAPDGAWVPDASAYPGVVSDKQGRLYGPTDGGGAERAGTVFQLTPPSQSSGTWGESVLYGFTGSQFGSGDGYLPSSDLVFGGQGQLYGTTYSGGTHTCIIGGCGTAYELKPPSAPGEAWIETVIYDFGTDAYGPYGPLLRTFDGTLYGISYGGGVFQLKPPAAVGGAWTERVIYYTVFAEGLTLGPDGVIYGTTNAGGDFESGTVYSLTPPSVAGGIWSQKVLYSFGGFQGDGRAPFLSSVVVGNNGVLYGTTAGGGAFGFGTVYALKPPNVAGQAWTEKVLHSFTGGGDGAQPEGSLVAGGDGILYGTTSGTSLMSGTVFQLIP